MRSDRLPRRERRDPRQASCTPVGKAVGLVTSSPPIVRDPGVVAFAILGPLEVTVGGVDLEVPGPKERRVLAMLVASAGDTVLTDRIADALWGEDLPRSSGKAVQNLVLRIRKLVGGEVIETRQGGYALRAGADAVDAHRFEDWCTRGANGALEPIRRRPSAAYRSRSSCGAGRLWSS